MDTRVKPFVRIEQGALDESAVSPGSVVLRGRIAASTLRFLKVDTSYQRALRPRADIYAALKSGHVVPDIDVGIRGQDYYCDGDDFVIRSPCYIIDGWQRVGNALQLLDMVPDTEVRIGALLHFDTTPEWEAARFTALNLGTRRVSPNLHLRNLRGSNGAVLTLYGLCENDRASPLLGRVCWEQDMHKRHLFTARLIALVALEIHRRFAPGAYNHRVEHLAAALANVAGNVSLQRFRANCLTYFQVVEECFTVSAIRSRASGGMQIRGAFLVALARLFARHANFWEGGASLGVEPLWRRALGRFPVDDPEYMRLAGGGSAGGEMLYEILVRHMNSGRRTHRLEPWPSDARISSPTPERTLP